MKKQNQIKKIDALLNKYLSGAVQKLQGKTKSEAEVSAKAYASVGYILSDRMAGVEIADVKAKEKEIKNALKTYGLKARYNYKQDAEFKKENDQALKMRGKNPIVNDIAKTVVAAGMASLIAWGISAVNEKAGIAAAAYMGFNMTVNTITAHASRSKTDAEHKKFMDYADLKHAQLALKKLKKNMLKDGKGMAYDAKDKDVKRPTVASIVAKGASR